MSRVPSALHPYLTFPPEASLTLVTGTLGCSTTWLTTRFIGFHLSPSGLVREDETGSRESAQDSSMPGHDDRPLAPKSEHTAVILVSWLRDAAFWKVEIARTTRIDISRPSQSTVSFHFLPQLTHPSPILSALPTAITAITTSLPPGAKTLLILDGPETSLYLSAPTPTAHDDLSITILHCRRFVSATLVCATADQPFLAAAATAQEGPASGGPVASPLEAATAAFVVAQAHAARLVMSVRELDTGAAKDVSGVLRVTRGGIGDEEEEDDAEAVKEMEALYLVQRDGNVKVFERGSGD